jgi:hypothetical protein
MKRALFIVLVLAAVLVVSGCSFSKTYYIAFTTAGLGYCQEVSTNDSNLQQDLESSGYTEGTCSGAGYSGQTCSLSGLYSGKSYTITQYFQGDWAAAYGSIEAYCESSGWTYNG